MKSTLVAWAVLVLAMATGVYRARTAAPGSTAAILRAGKLRDPGAVPVLLERLADPAARPHALWALAEIGENARAAIAGISAWARASDPMTRVRVAVALSRIDAGDPVAKAALARLGTDANPLVRAVARGLGGG